MWNFTVDDECKALTLTDEILLTTTKLKVNGKQVGSIKKEAMFSNITDKCLQILKVMAKKGKFYTVQSVETDQGMLMLCRIKQTKESAFLFEIFKKLGLPTQSLDIGYVKSSGIYKVYLNKKTNKSLEGLVDNIKSRVILYLISIAEFLVELSMSSILSSSTLFEYADFENSISVSTKEDFNLADFIPSFKENTVVTIVDFDDIEKISSIGFVRRPFTGIKSYVDLDMFGSYTLFTNEHTKYLLFKYGDPGVVGNYLLLNTDNNIIYTSAPILIDDINEDSYISHIMDKFPIGDIESISFIYAETPPELFKAFKFEVIDESISRFNEIVEYFNAKGITEKTPLKILKEIFGDCFTSSLVELDRASFIEQYDKDEFAKELLATRFEYYDNFKLPFSNDILKGIASGKIYSMLFSGESGTGKTTAAKVICDRVGLPLVTINLSLNCEESDIFGCMVPNPYKEKPEDPEFIWKDGPATKAIRNGYALTFEEINGGRPGVLMKLNSLLDETRQIELSSGEIVKAHPNCRIFGTCNIGYEGTNRFNKALVNRFEIVKIFEEPEKEECFDIIKNRLGYTNTANMENIWKLYETTKKYCKENNLDVIISIRQLLNIFRLGGYYKTAKEAYIDIVLNNAFLEEEEHLENFVETVLNAYPMSFKI